MEDLGHVGILSAGDSCRIGSGERSVLRDSRLGTAADSKFLTGDELNVVGGFHSAADSSGQGSSGIALVKEHAGVVQYGKTGCISVSHF